MHDCAIANIFLWITRTIRGIRMEKGAQQFLQTLSQDRPSSSFLLPSPVFCIPVMNVGLHWLATCLLRKKVIVSSRVEKAEVVGRLKSMVSLIITKAPTDLT